MAVVLAAGCREMWQHRFQAAPGQPPLTLGYTPEGIAQTVHGVADLPAGRDGAMSLTAAEVSPQVNYQWFTEPATAYAYISIEAECEGVVQGLNYWDDARVTATWYDRDGKRLPDFLPIWSGKGTRPMGFREMIMPMMRHGGLPRIAVENLGSAGHMTVKSLTVQPVVEPSWFRPAVCGMIVAWLILLYAALRRWVAPGIAWWRLAAAAATCIVFTWKAAFPGPWMPLEALHQRFAVTPLPLPEIPHAPEAAPGTETPLPPAEPGPPEPPKKVEIPAFPAEVKGPPEHLTGSIVRDIFTNMPFLKKYVHVLAFGGLALALAFLTGTRRAGYVAFAFGFLSEFCEWAFGFGVDWDDGLDLVLDATGAVLGVLVWKLTSKWLAKWIKRRPTPPAVAE